MIEELNGDFLQWLRGFYYITQTGSIRRAAQRMNRNPSTISYQLRSLEQELNTVLFDRCKKSLQITPEGQRLLKWTIATFETLLAMRADVGARPGGLQGTVAFTSNLPFAAQIVDVISRFRQTYPKVNIKIRRALTFEVVDDVESSRVDFGLTGVTVPTSNSELETLFQSRPVLIVRKDNTNKLPKKPTLQDLERLPFVSFLSEKMDDTGDPYFGMQLNLNTFIKRNTVLSVNNYHLMLRYVMEGVGVAIMDEMCLKASLYGKDWSMLRCYPLDHLLPIVDYGILVRKRKHLSPQAAGLIEELRAKYLAT